MVIANLRSKSDSVFSFDKHADARALYEITMWEIAQRLLSGAVPHGNHSVCSVVERAGNVALSTRTGNATDTPCDSV